MTRSDPPLPTLDEWASRGITDLDELDAGHQSRIFTAGVAGERLVVKLTDARFRDASSLAVRMEAVRTLATHAPAVVAPIPIAGELVQVIGGWLLTATPFIDGVPPDVEGENDVHLMGSMLDLHGDARLVHPL